MSGAGDSATSRVLALRTTLPRSIRAAGQARRFVGQALASWSVPHLIDDLLLACSELVTNALEHGSGKIRLELERRGACVRLRVGDEGTGTPHALPLNGVSERQRGLGIVAALSTAWGWEPAESGKWVWADFGTSTGSLQASK